jgi:hypothetical protein
MFIPIGLAMHLAHNLSHLLLEGGGIVPVVQRAAATYSGISLGEPDWHAAPLAPESVVGLLQAVVAVGFFALTLTTGHRLAARVYADRGAARRAVVPFAILAVMFTVVGIVLLQQPMGMRHGMWGRISRIVAALVPDMCRGRGEALATISEATVNPRRGESCLQRRVR